MTPTFRHSPSNPPNHEAQIPSPALSPSPPTAVHKQDEMHVDLVYATDEGESEIDMSSDEEPPSHPTAGPSRQAAPDNQVVQDRLPSPSPAAGCRSTTEATTNHDEERIALDQLSDEGEPEVETSSDESDEKPLRFTARQSRSRHIHRKARVAEHSPYPQPAVNKRPRRAPRVTSPHRGKGRGRMTPQAPTGITRVKPADNTCPHCADKRSWGPQELRRHIDTHFPKSEAWRCVGVKLVDLEDSGIAEQWIAYLEDRSEGNDEDEAMKGLVGGCGKQLSRCDALHRHLQSDTGFCVGYWTARNGVKNTDRLLIGGRLKGPYDPSIRPR